MEDGFKILARLPADQRHQKLRRRQRLEDFRGCAQHELAVHLELGHAASRQQRERGFSRVELEDFARLAPARRGGSFRGQRMTDESNRQTCRRIQRRLEGEQRQQPVGRTRDRVDALASPCPDRRTHIVDRAHASPLERGFQAQIEVGCVDADE